MVSIHIFINVNSFLISYNSFPDPEIMLNFGDSRYQIGSIFYAYRSALQRDGWVA